MFFCIINLIFVLSSLACSYLFGIQWQNKQTKITEQNKTNKKKQIWALIILSGASVVVRHSGVRRSGLTEIAKNRLLKCGCFLDLLFILAAVWFFPSIAYPSAHISEPFLWNLIRVFFILRNKVGPTL